VDDFGLGEHPTKLVTWPAAAALFERGDVRTPDRPTIVRYTTEGCLDLIRKVGVPDGWLPGPTRFGVDQSAVLKGPVQFQLAPDGTQVVPPPKTAAANPVVSDTGELSWMTERDKEHGFVTVAAQRSKAVIGVPDGRAFKLGDDVEVTTGKTIQNWAAVTLTVLDGENFKTPARILITATGYIQNTGMIWKDAKHDSVGKDWGHAPALLEGIPATIVLPLAEGMKIRAWTLDGRGQRGEEVPVKAGAGKATILIGPEFKTPWYEVETTR
jgi:hypothetical protein